MFEITVFRRVVLRKLEVSYEIIASALNVEN
jgi:hypothetical protein